MSLSVSVCPWSCRPIYQQQLVSSQMYYEECGGGERAMLVGRYFILGQSLWYEGLLYNIPTFLKPPLVSTPPWVIVSSNDLYE